MPRFEKTDPLIEQLPKELPVEYALPDINEIVSDASQDAAVMDLVNGWVSSSSARIYQGGGQIGLGQIATNIGVSSVETFGAITEALDMDVIDSVDATLVGEAGSILSAFSDMADSDALVKKAMEVGIGISVQLMSQIPVVGWIAKLAWNLGNAIRQIVAVVKQSSADDEPPKYPAVQFNPETDWFRFNNDVLKPLRTSHDWTHMFRPPGGGVPADAAWLKEFFVAPLEGGGVRIAASNPCSQCLGYIPGTAFLHNDIEMFHLQLKDTGNMYLPSSRQHGLWIWKHISRHNTPALFTVDAGVLASTWGGYIKTLRQFVEGNPDLSNGQMDKIVNYYNKDEEGLKIFGWGGPRTHDAGAWIPDEDVEKYQPVRESVILKERQLRFCDTLTVAYVDSTFGALKDPDVKAKWDERRHDLLQHPAVCDVQLDMIPDAVYRGQVEFEQEKRGFSCQLGPQSIAAVIVDVPEGQGGAAGVDGKTSKPGTPGGNAALISLAILAGGGAAYYYRDDLRRFARDTRDRLRRLRGRR